MKKILFIFFLVLLIYSNQKEKSVTVFNNYDDNYQSFELDLTTCNITTNNIETFFKDINVEYIYPNIHKSYLKVLSNDLKYFKVNDLQLDDFIIYYKNLLKKIGKNNMINYIYYDGVKIDKIIVFTSFEKVNNLLNNNKCINII